jgi:hypothetical protein
MKTGFTVEQKKKSKDIFATGRGGLQGSETSSIPYFLDSRPTDGGEAVSLTRRPRLTARKIPGTHFCSGRSKLQDHSAAECVRY